MTHLPVVLEPQEEILDNLAIKGGAFSGSALPMGDEVYFYLTRHIGPQDDGWETIQYQTMTKSSDMIHFEPEKEIIRRNRKVLTMISVIRKQLKLVRNIILY